MLGIMLLSGVSWGERHFSKMQPSVQGGGHPHASSLVQIVLQDRKMRSACGGHSQKVAGGQALQGAWGNTWCGVQPESLPARQCRV